MIELDKETLLAIVAMICITSLSAIALFLGIDGLLLTAVIGTLAAGGGLIIGRKITKKEDY